MGAIESIHIEAKHAPGAKTAARASVLDRAKEFLTFGLGSEEYGIDILKVQEIRNYDKPTQIANAPACIKGVIDLRGVIVPIVDLRLKLGVSDAKYDEFTVVIILNVQNRVIGAVVDSVSDVIELKPEQVRPAPEWSETVDAKYLVGLGTLRNGDKDRMLILVDIEHLLGASEMALAAKTKEMS